MKSLILLLAIAIALNSNIASAEEGMWTFTNPPVEDIKEIYGFEIGAGWLDSVRLACIKLDRGSATFVSENGLAMTNHHVVVDDIAGLENSGEIMEKGFVAGGMANEIKLENASAKVLAAMVYPKNIKEKSAGVSFSDDDAEKLSGLKSEELAEELEKITGLKFEKVSLYGGAETWLYGYKVFHDVRLVFVPDKYMAVFGGYYHDNFVFPRYNLDVAFIRIYDDGEPVKPEVFLPFKKSGPEKSSLTFIAGNPGFTKRNIPSNQLELLRDYVYPRFVDNLQMEYDKISGGGADFSRYLHLLNGLKIFQGYVDGLNDDNVMQKAIKQEELLLAEIAEDKSLSDKYLEKYERAMEMTEQMENVFRKLKFYSFDYGAIADLAYHLYKYNKEYEENKAASELPEKKEFEEVIEIIPEINLVRENERFESRMLQAIEELGQGDSILRIILNGMTPAEAADYYINKTKLTDTAYVRSILKMNRGEIMETAGPALKLAMQLGPYLDSLGGLRKRYSASLLGFMGRGELNQFIDRAKYEAFGDNVYPDATFTLRMTYGKVAGYTADGFHAPYKTTLYGLFNRSLSFDNEGDYIIPQNIMEKRGLLNMETQVNFVSTNDIIGGNSGSSVINKHKQIVGIVFDGNYYSIPGFHVYEGSKNRAVSVSAAYIHEMLGKVYDADKLLEELSWE